MTIRVIKELMIEVLTFLKNKQENEMIKMVSYQQRLVKASIKELMSDPSR